MCTLPLGMKKRSSESNVEVEIHDGEDGGIVMEVHNTKHRGTVQYFRIFSYDRIFFSFMVKKKKECRVLSF